jgi:peptide/nickel transport system permease protein
MSMRPTCVRSPSFDRLRGLTRSPAAMAGAALLAAVVIAALAASWLAPFDPLTPHLSERLLPPGRAHPFGTDGLGRDLLSRVLYGARPTLGLAALVVLISVPCGLVVGVLSGYYGGFIERTLMRLTDIVMALPQLVLALAFVGVMGPGLVHAALALVLTGWPAYARLARAETRLLRRHDYLAAAEMQGIRGARLLLGHIVPACWPTVQVRVALDLASIVLAAAGLGFLGLGIQPPQPEWGAMVAQGSKVIFDQWWVSAIPGAAILLLSIAFNLLADGLRDLGDPGHE